MIPYEKKEHYTIDDLAEIVTLLRSADTPVHPLRPHRGDL